MANLFASKLSFVAYSQGMLAVGLLFMAVKACKHADHEDAELTATQGAHSGEYPINKATYRCYGALSDPSCMVESRDSVSCGYGRGNRWIGADPGYKVNGHALNAGISANIMVVNGTTECGQCLEVRGSGGMAYVMVTDRGHSSGNGYVETDTIDLDNEVYMRVSGESLDQNQLSQRRYVMSTQRTSAALSWKHPVSVRKIPCHQLFSDRRVMYVPLDVSAGSTDFNIRRGKTAINLVEMSLDNGASWKPLKNEWGATYRLWAGYQTGLSANKHVKVRITWKDNSQFVDSFQYNGSANSVLTGTSSW